MRKLFLIAWFVTIVLLTRCLDAQVATSNLVTVDSLAVMDAVPSDPVFELLGLNGNQIGQPGTPKTLLSNLGSALDSKGNLEPGFGLTIAPVLLFDGEDQYYSDYVTKYWTRFVDNLLISAGTAPSRRADSSLDFGIGIRFVFYNSGDGRLDTQYVNEVVNAIHSAYQNFHLNHLKKGEQYTPEMRAEDSIMNVRISNNQALVDLMNETSTQSAREKQSKWSSSFLQFDIGTAYRNSGTYFSKSMWDRSQAILNGGIGSGGFQLLGQIGGIFRNTNPDYYGPDSASSFESALQLKAGWKNLRFAFGARGVGGQVHVFNQGTLAFASELRMTSDMWCLFSVTRDLITSQRSGPWIAGFTLKTSMGNLSL